MTRIVVTHYTDPWSVWCWAIEPQLLRLRERHAEHIDFVVRLGAILETSPPPGFPLDEVVRMFYAARRQSGMPLDPDIVTKRPTPTTIRAGIAAKAAALAAPDKAEAYLRRLRFAGLVEGQDIEALDVQESLAKEVGIEASALREALETDEATREFYGDQAEARLKGISGFPTVTFRNAQGVEVGVGGFQPTEAYEAALLRVRGARFVEAPAPETIDLLRRRGMLATAEISEVHDELEDVTTERMLTLEREGRVAKRSAAGGYFWSATDGVGRA